MNTLGQQVEVLVNNCQEADYHEINWDAGDLSSSSTSIICKLEIFLRQRRCS